MSRRRLLRRALALSLALAVLVLVGATVDRQEMAQVLAQADPGMLALAAVLYVPSWVLRGWRWQQLARDMGDRLELMPATALATVGNMLNLVLPAKAGDLLWANGAVQRWGMPYGRAVVGVLAGRVLDLLVLVGLGALALVRLRRDSFTPLDGDWAGVSEGAALGGMAVVVGLGWLLGVRLRLGRALLVGPLRRLRGVHDALIGPMNDLTRSPLQAVKHLGITAMIWANEGLVAWLAARSLGLELGPELLLFAIMVANLSKIFPLTPASFGTYEAAGALALGVAGLAYSAAFAVMLTEHVLKNLVNLALGVVGLVGWQVPVLQVDLPGLRRAWRDATTAVDQP